MDKRHRTTPPKLRFRPRERFPVHRLPFVGGQSERGLGVSYWNVPEDGGYIGGCRTGSALALLYLQFLRADGDSEGPCQLQNMVLDMTHASGLSAARKGQVVGFFTALEPVLITCCRGACGHNLDSMNRKTLLREANAGLAFDEDAWLAEQAQKEKSSGGGPADDQPDPTR